MRHLLTYIILVTGYISFSQIKFQKTYGGTGWEAPPHCFGKYYGGLVETKDGGYAISHSTTSYGKWSSLTKYSAFFLKLDQNGDTIFSRVYSVNSYSTTHASGMNLYENQDGSFLMGTYYNGGVLAGGGAGLLKIKQNGDTLWSRRFVHNSLSGLINGNYMTVLKDMCVISLGEYAGTNKGVIVKLDSAGNLVFGKTIKTNGGSINLIRGIELNNGDLLLTGSITFSGNQDIVLLQTNKNGNFKWMKRYGTIASEEAYDIKVFNDKSILITGNNINTADKIFLLKTDSIGNIIFNYETEAFNYGITHTILLDSQDNIYLSGNIAVNPTTSRALLMKFNSSGNVQWAKTYGLSNEYGGTVIRTKDKGFAFLGMRQIGSSLNESDLYMVKTDSLGYAGCFTSIPVYTISAATYTAVQINSVVVTPEIIAISAPLHVTRGVVQTNVCFTTNSDEIDYSDDLNLFPNPVQNNINIKSNKFNGETYVQITDVCGRIISSFNLNIINEISLDVSNLSNGIYLITLKNENQVFSKKFIKE